MINVIQNPSNNFNSVDSHGNSLVIKPSTIVIHWMAGYFQPSIDWMKNPVSQVSAHLGIDADGKRVNQLVPFYRRAWHCGGSWHELFGSDDANLWTVGIECEGQPSAIKRKGWSDSFVTSLIELCEYVKAECPTIKYITDHSTIDPVHKIDVKQGKGVDLFPWQDFVSILSGSGIQDISIEPYATNTRHHFGLK